jgi:hypothetical protein
VLALLEIVQTLCRLRLLRLRGKAKVSTDSNKGNDNDAPNNQQRDRRVGK